ncbi:unnamed protein product [Protopolystoma xenopodis]|uniref:Uncharacterized protein n=1 Tax=Protopolystoma xenopodis TaxID=117903 RepID=A0A3S5B3R3_9PLAT|nr:unnamed protein product [Protopolystoma xenopodis]
MQAHNWGKIIDMAWLPLTSFTAAGHPKSSISNDYGDTLEETAADRLLGHLIVASTDGFVRVVPVARHLVDRTQPVSIDEDYTLKCSPSVDEFISPILIAYDSLLPPCR